MTSQEGRDKFYKDATMAKTAETEDASRHRREMQEERAMFLRDDKLLSAAQDPRLNRHYSSEGEHHAASLRPSHALTKENVESYNEKIKHDGSTEDQTSAADAMREILGQKLLEAQTNSGRMGKRTLSEDVMTKRPTLAQKSERWESEKTITKR